MIIDFHTHIFPKDIRENREKYFPSEPAFKLLYESPKSKLVGAKAIVAAMDDQGVDRSVVFGFPWKNADTFKRQNDYIMDAVARFPDPGPPMSTRFPFRSSMVLIPAPRRATTVNGSAYSENIERSSVSGPAGSKKPVPV